MKTWLKGGLIGLFIGIALMLLVLLSDFIFTCRFDINKEFCGFLTMILAIPVIIISPIVGMIIGAIIGKIKSKK